MIMRLKTVQQITGGDMSIVFDLKELSAFASKDYATFIVKLGENDMRSREDIEKNINYLHKEIEYLSGKANKFKLLVDKQEEELKNLPKFENFPCKIQIKKGGNNDRVLINPLICNLEMNAQYQKDGFLTICGISGNKYKIEDSDSDAPWLRLCHDIDENFEPYQEPAYKSPKINSFLYLTPKVLLMMDMLQWVKLNAPDWRPAWGDFNKKNHGIIIGDNERFISTCLSLGNGFVFGISVPDSEMADALLKKYEERLNDHY